MNVCFAGPMLGKHANWVPSQAETLASLLQLEGSMVRLTSSQIRPLPRVADTAYTLLRWRRRMDVLNVMVFSGKSFAIADMTSRIGRLIGVPQVFHLRGGDLPTFAERHPDWMRSVLARAAVLVAPSAYLAAQLHPWTGREIRVIPNVIPLERYGFRLRDRCAPRLLWMRTFENPIYHPELAVRALRLVKDRFPDAALTMAGQDRGARATVLELTEQLDLGDSVRVVGFLDDAAKAAEFASHDIFLNTNRVDNMPVSVVEAMAFGLPVVATEVGGIPYLLTDGSTALLTPDGDTAAMAFGVIRLVEDQGLAARLSLAGRSLAEQSSWQAVGSAWRNVLREVTDHGSH